MDTESAALYRESPNMTLYREVTYYTPGTRPVLRIQAYIQGTLGTLQEDMDTYTMCTVD
jgi:hypothetical protein